jgi:hypothetical protein
MRPAAPRGGLERILAAPARHGGEEKGKNGGEKNGKNGKEEEGKNGDNGEDEGKTVCKQKFGFNIPLGRTPKCGAIKGEVEKEIKVQCPPPPEKPGLCPGDYPNGNGNGNGKENGNGEENGKNGKNGKEKKEEKEEEAAEEEGGGGFDRVWDVVHGG